MSGATERLESAAVSVPSQSVAMTPWRRARRIVLLVVALSVAPALVSFAQALIAPSDVSVSIRSVEWLRDHGASGLVSNVEDAYYSLTVPAKGGASLAGLPSVGVSGSNPRRPGRAYRPPRIRPVISPALPGEGVWRPAIAHAGPRPAVLLTTLRGERDYPRLVAGVAWIDMGAAKLSYIPGVLEPPVPIRRGPEEVPASMRGDLAATFNGGFKLHDAAEGFAYQGHTWTPMVRGIATVIQFRSGRVDIRSWRSGPRAPTDVVFARQNLPLIIDGGRRNPNLSDGPQWGATVHNAIRVWRSGLGIDRHGNLIYAAANQQMVGSLADILLRAGARRAIELDINEYWTSFITYRHRSAAAPSNLLPDMVRPATRYLTPDDRDFFAVFARPGAK